MKVYLCFVFLQHVALPLLVGPIKTSNASVVLVYMGKLWYIDVEHIAINLCFLILKMTINCFFLLIHVDVG
jgi:hypothetical protein